MHNVYITKLFKSISQLCKLAFLLLFASSVFAHDTEVNHLELGVYPHLSQKHLERAYSAIATELTKATQQPVWFDAADNLKNFHKNLVSQKSWVKHIIMKIVNILTNGMEQ